MNRTKKFVVALGIVAISAAGCKSCGDDPSDDNNTATNNANTNSGTNNGTQNNNNGTTVVECNTRMPLEIPNDGSDVTIAAGEEGTCFSSDGIRISDRLLTIEPGVIIEFEENSALEVDANGKLSIKGTADDPVILTAEKGKESPGYWAGIHLDRPNSVDTVIDHVIVQYAGRDQPGALTIAHCCGADTRVSVTNSIFEFSATLGVHIDELINLEAFENNIMRNNVEGAAFVHASVLGKIGEGNEFTGNDVDVVFTEGTVNDGEEHNWGRVDVPVQVRDNIRLSGDSLVSVGPGMTFQFEETFGVTVDDGSGFAIHGEDGNETLFTGTEQTRGHWGGFKFDRGDLDTNVFEYATIEYAGNDQDGAIVAETCCGDTGMLSLSNITIRETEGFGLVIAERQELPTYENVTLTANSLGAVRAPAEAIAQLKEGNYDGNDVDIVEITGGAIIVNGSSWVNPGVPYRVTGDIRVQTMMDLTLSPGTAFEFADEFGFDINAGAWLNAVGTSTDPIVFRGVNDVAGAWRSLRFDRSAGTDNQLDFVEVHNTGAGNSTAAVEIEVCCGDNTSMTLGNLTISSSTKAALSVPNANTNFAFTGCQNITISDTVGEVVRPDNTTLTLAEFQALCM